MICHQLCVFLGFWGGKCKAVLASEEKNCGCKKRICNTSHRLACGHDNHSNSRCIYVRCLFKLASMRLQYSRDVINSDSWQWRLVMESRSLLAVQGSSYAGTCRCLRTSTLRSLRAANLLRSTRPAYWPLASTLGPRGFQDHPTRHVEVAWRRPLPPVVHWEVLLCSNPSKKSPQTL